MSKQNFLVKDLRGNTRKSERKDYVQLKLLSFLQHLTKFMKLFSVHKNLKTDFHSRTCIVQQQ